MESLNRHGFYLPTVRRWFLNLGLSLWIPSHIRGAFDTNARPRCAHWTTRAAAPHTWVPRTARAPPPVTALPAHHPTLATPTAFAPTPTTRLMSLPPANRHGAFSGRSTCWSALFWRVCGAGDSPGRVTACRAVPVPFTAVYSCWPPMGSGIRAGLAKLNRYDARTQLPSRYLCRYRAERYCPTGLLPPYLLYLDIPPPPDAPLPSLLPPFPGATITIACFALPVHAFHAWTHTLWLYSNKPLDVGRWRFARRRQQVRWPLFFRFATIWHAERAITTRP